MSFFDLFRFFSSVKWAFHGIKEALKREQNFRIESFCFLFVLILGFILRLSKLEWIFILGACFLVLFAELINTAIERLSDLIVDKRKTGLVKQAKDTGAAAVLIVCLHAIAVGSIIFLPKIIVLLSK